jgi:Flp pilus assembly protein CpaB
MNFGRILLIVGIIIIVGVLAYVAYRFLRPPAPPPPPVEVEETPQPEVVNMVQIAVAAQNIPRGMTIEADANAVTLQSWPVEGKPIGAISNLETIYNRVARVDIARGTPVVESMLTKETADHLEGTGSDMALMIPQGRVGYALPMSRYSSMAWALQPGDHVDVIISLLFVDLDEESQTLPPNQASCVSPSEEEGCSSGLYGRLETLPNGWLVNVLPRGEQRPRLITQLTVQDAVVLQIGDYEPFAEAAAGEGEEEGGEEEQPPPPEEGEEEVAPPAPRSGRVEPVTLAVTRQDAMVLDYALTVGARINMVLRRSGETSPATTESVTLQYVMDRFNIELPPKLPYGVTPPIAALDRIAGDESAAEYGEPRSFEYWGEEQEKPE